MGCRLYFLVSLIAVAANAMAFDLEKTDLKNSLWRKVDEKEADVLVEVKATIAGLFHRTERFYLQYLGKKIVVRPDGTMESRDWSNGGAPRDFDTRGNKGWIYIREIAEGGPVVRMVVRETPEDGRVLYNRGIVIPWQTKFYSLHSDRELIDAQIIPIVKTSENP